MKYFHHKGGSPHRYQAKKSKYPKTRKLTSSGENAQFLLFWGHYKILKLMGMGWYHMPIKLRF
ncbi:hypothetical protein CN286_24660 [Bacillus anthracis]|nr:hypothetical protein CN286_24660 [Bacillus anthracis]